MCFTIEVHLSRKSIENRFRVDTGALREFEFLYFYRAFSNPRIPVISMEQPGSAVLMKWGLIPFWTGDRTKAEKIRRQTYNARAETIHEKPSFREPFSRGRCLVLAHGFFEWQHVRGAKIPWYIRLKNDKPFAFAGLCDTWQDPETGDSLKTCSIVTTAASPLMEKIHNSRKRMPVILPEHLEKEWIEGDLPPGELKSMLQPFDDGQLHAHTLSPAISSRDADPADPELLKEQSPGSQGSLF